MGAGKIAQRKLEEIPQEHKNTIDFLNQYLDFLTSCLETPPNISVLSSEAYMMFTANKTKQWLESKYPDEQQCLVTLAQRDMNKVFNREFQKKKTRVFTTTETNIKGKNEKAEEMEVKRVARLQGYTDRIIYFGLWQSVDTVNAALQEIESRKEQREASN